MSPSPAEASGANAYDPTGGETGLAGWYDRNAGLVAGAAEAGIGIAVTIGTAGTFAALGATLTASGVALIAGAAGGLAGGIASGWGNGYIAGDTGGKLAADIAIGGLAGAAGGAVGGFAAGSVAGQFCPAALTGWIVSGAVGGAAGGATGGAIQGGYAGYQSGGLAGIAGGAVEGAVNGAVSGAEFGAAGGALAWGGATALGLLDGYTCFVAGTQVVTGIERENRSREEMADTASVAVATKVRVRYRTASIESLIKGQSVMGRSENDPNAPMRSYRIEEVFKRTAYHLRILTIRSSSGQVQILLTTNEHPVYHPETGWTAAGELKVGQQILEPFGGLSTIEANAIRSASDRD